MIVGLKVKCMNYSGIKYISEQLDVDMRDLIDINKIILP